MSRWPNVQSVVCDLDLDAGQSLLPRVLGRRCEALDGGLDVLGTPTTCARSRSLPTWCKTTKPDCTRPCTSLAPTADRGNRSRLRVLLDLGFGGEPSCDETIAELFHGGPLKLGAGPATHREVGLGVHLAETRVGQQSRQRPAVGQIDAALGEQGTKAVLEFVGTASSDAKNWAVDGSVDVTLSPGSPG